MIKNEYLILGLFLLLFQLATAQQPADNIVRGNVFSKTDGPLMMVNIVETDPSNRILSATATDMNGNFSLKIKNQNNVLKFSYIGFKTLSFPIGNQRMFNVEMKDDSKKINEITIVAKKKVNTGSFEIDQRQVSMAMQTISTKEFEGISVPSIDDALQGQIAGLDIMANSGDAGSGMSMRIRGVTSINANTEPLIVLDGVIFETPVSDNFDFATANNEKFAELLCINPDDIESITVLKDAASTAIWGSKGANGVLSITTKKGRKGKTKVQYTYRFSGAWQPQGYKMLNGDDYTMLMKEAYFNPKQSDNASNIREFNYDPTFSEYENYNNNTNWVDEVSQFGYTNDHYVTMSGGGDKARFLISGGYFNNVGSVIEQSLDRYSTRMNLDYFVSDRIKFTSEFSFTYTDNDKNYDKLLEIAYKKMPNLSVYAQDASGNNTSEYYKMPAAPITSSQLSDQLGMPNPVASANLAINNLKSYRILPTFRLQYDLLDPDKQTLRLNSVVSFDVNNNSTYSFLPKELTISTWLSGNVNKTSSSESRSLSLRVENKLTWIPKFENKDHELMMVGSMQMGSSTSRYQSISAYGLPDGDITGATAGGYVSDFNTGPGSGRSMGFYLFSHYAFKSKYIFDFTFRRDGSTKYGENRRWGNFPGVSFRWNIVDEPFMKKTSNWLSELSVRPSWGITGNQPKYESLFYSLYNPYSSYIDISTIRPTNIQLADLRWEKVSSFNYGMDFGFFDNAITADFNYYYKRTEDMLFESLSIPSSTGYGALSYQNAGTMDNEGWEFNFHANKFVKAGDFSMDLNFNLSNYINTIVDLKPEILKKYNGNVSYENGKYLTRIQLNNSFGSIYGYKYLGVYQYNDYVEGRKKTSPFAKDIDGQVILDSNGDPLPMYFAHGTSAAYKFKGGDAIYEDINHDGNINELDIVYLGNSNPIVNGGMGLKFNYKRLSLNLFSNFRFGNKIVNTARMNAENMYSNNNQCASVNWRWRKDGDLTTMPRALYKSGYNWLGSDRYVEDGSFFKIKYITLNYGVDPNFVKKLSLSQLSFYFTMNNLITFTKYSGVDPEVGYGSLGVSTDASQTPRSVSFTTGVTIGF